MRSRRVGLKCGLGSLAPTCCLPTLRSYGGPPHFVVFTAGTCIPGIALCELSRAAHYLSVCLSLAPCAQTSIAVLPRDEKEQEWGQRRARGRGSLTRGGWKRREIRGEDRPAGEWWSLFGMLWIFTAIVRCQYPPFTPWLPAEKGKGGSLQVLVYTFFKQKKGGLDDRR